MSAAVFASPTRETARAREAGHPAHPVSLAKRDIEMVSYHVTLNGRHSAVRYLAVVTEPPPIPRHTA
jgi:hypothetical protein